MNLKESFRYQKFLESLMHSAGMSIQQRDHCLKTTKTHMRNKANADAQDLTEVVECENAFYPNDIVVEFMVWLVGEREKLTTAIGRAKASVGFDIDAAVETNKFRQLLNSSVKGMLRYTPSKRVEQGRDYKFNVEGNQTPYYYDIEVVTEEAYDRETAKKIMRDMISTADKTSAGIDAAMINTVVDYTPVYDVNESFDDVMAEFMAAKQESTE